MRLRPAIAILAFAALAVAQSPQTSKRYEDSIVIAPMYVEYTTHNDRQFAQEVALLKERVGTAPHVLLGFASSVLMDFSTSTLDEPLSPASMSAALTSIDQIVDRSRANDLAAHVSIGSGFFHSMNQLRPLAIERDVRNAQWFSDGWIDEPSRLAKASGVPRTVWITASRYARPLRARMEEGTRIIGSRLAARMAEGRGTITVSGDGEVELTYERSIEDGERRMQSEPLLADYSPFMIEEFRDSIRLRYEGDLTPGTDDNRDGKTFNRDFKQSFATWKLRYFDASGPIPYATYIAMKDKLPESGPYFIKDGFDAPRRPKSGDVWWESWIQFRKQVIANYVRDFATWITTSPDPVTGKTVPSNRYYSHQIPADFLFGERDNLRLQTSASSLATAQIAPLGATGITMFNAFNGTAHKKTASSELFNAVANSSPDWGILEYNPSMPTAGNLRPSTDVAYFLDELRFMYSYRPHVIVPFAWSDVAGHQHFNIKNTAFEKALKAFIAEVGETPWAPRISR